MRKPIPPLIFALFISALLLPCFAWGGDSLGAAAGKLTRKLNSQSSLAGKHIQLLSSEFREQSSGMTLPFSQQLSAALATALSDTGAIVSIHETGKEPLRLIGSYTRAGKNLAVTVRLRKMANSGSQDHGVATGHIPLEKIDGQLLNPSLVTLVNKFIKQLEKTYLDMTPSYFVVIQPTPGELGEPTLKLGSVLKKTLEQALSGSETFGSRTIVGTTSRQVKVVSSYDINPMDETVRFTASLVDENKQQLADASGQLPKTAISPDLFALVQDHERNVCVNYSPLDKRAVPVDSPTIAYLVANITSTLNSFGIQPVDCTLVENGIKVSSSLVIRKKKMNDGYGLLSAELRIQVYDNNNPGGTVTGKGRVPFTGRANDSRTRLVDKLFTPQLQQQLAEHVLAWRTGSTTD